MANRSIAVTGRTNVNSTAVPPVLSFWIEPMSRHPREKLDPSD